MCSAMNFPRAPSFRYSLALGQFFSIFWSSLGVLSPVREDRTPYRTHHRRTFSRVLAHVTVAQDFLPTRLRPIVPSTRMTTAHLSLGIPAGGLGSRAAQKMRLVLTLPVVRPAAIFELASGPPLILWTLTAGAFSRTLNPCSGLPSLVARTIYNESSASSHIKALRLSRSMITLNPCINAYFGCPAQGSLCF